MERPEAGRDLVASLLGRHLSARLGCGTDGRILKTLVINVHVLCLPALSGSASFHHDGSRLSHNAFHSLRHWLIKYPDGGICQMAYADVNKCLESGNAASNKFHFRSHMTTRGVVVHKTNGLDHFSDQQKGKKGLGFIFNCAILCSVCLHHRCIISIRIYFNKYSHSIHISLVSNSL